MNNCGNSATAVDCGGKALQGSASLAGDKDAAQQEAGYQSDSVLDGLTAAYVSARQVISDFFELLSLEAHRAGLTLMWMMAWGTFAMLLVVAAWLGLMSGLAVWAISLGLPWVPVIVGIAFTNLLVAAIILFRCIKMSRHLLFSATRRQLAGKSTCVS